MTISWYGEACFLLESGGVRVLIEPPSKESGINPPRLKSDILIDSRPGAEGDNAETFVISGPGEYEIKGISILGIADPSTVSASSPQASLGQVNTIYNIEIEDIKIVHLGFLNKDFNGEKMSFLNEPNVVLIPVGGGDVLDAEAAMKLANKIGASIIIPMLYGIKDLKIKRLPLSNFIKESEAGESAQPKLVLKKKDLDEEKTKIIILEKV